MGFIGSRVQETYTDFSIAGRGHQAHCNAANQGVSPFAFIHYGNANVSCKICLSATLDCSKWPP